MFWKLGTPTILGLLLCTARKNPQKVYCKSDNGILTIKFYSDKEYTQCFHEGWKIKIKELKN